jgi:hypothetical protein
MWYLLIPPTGASDVDVLAPFSRWTFRGSFDTLSECDKELRHLRARRLRMATVEEQYLRDSALRSAECAAEDDPRLKEWR